MENVLIPDIGTSYIFIVNKLLANSDSRTPYNCFLVNSEISIQESGAQYSAGGNNGIADQGNEGGTTGGGGSVNPNDLPSFPDINKSSYSTNSFKNPFIINNLDGFDLCGFNNNDVFYFKIVIPFGHSMGFTHYFAEGVEYPYSIMAYGSSRTIGSADLAKYYLAFPRSKTAYNNWLLYGHI
jgi:hypothetical protein